MILPDAIVTQGIALKDQYFDLVGLSEYSALKVSTLRSYIRSGKLPCFKLKGKVLVKRSEFDKWVEQYRLNRSQDLKDLARDVMDQIK